MKWMGPSLSGNLMNSILIRYETLHQTSEPLSRIGDARLLRRSGAAREEAISPALPEESHQPLRRNTPCATTIAAPVAANCSALAA